MRVLVVDDDEVVGRAIGRVLKSDHVVVEADPAHALATIVLGLFDVVLCDQHMPGVLGTELFDAIRARLGPSAPVLVLMTGDGEVAAPGADILLFKPFARSELIALMERAAAKCQAGDLV